MNPENALSQLSPGMAECHARLMAVAKHGTPKAFSATLAAVLQRAELSISNAYDAGAKSIQVEAIGACGVSGPLVGQPQAVPDLSQLTERGAKAWAGVDAQGLREGFTAADMATVSAQGFMDGVASVSAGSESMASYAIRLLVAAALITQAKADEALRLAAEITAAHEAADGERNELC